MSRLPQPNIPQSAQIRPKEAIEREAKQREDRDEGLALDIARAVLERHKGNVSADGRALADECEVIWKWITTNTWPPAGSVE